jgi:putative membrane protein
MQSIIKLAILPVLIFSSLFIIITEKSKFSALVIFILSGFLGIAVLNLNVNEPLLPLLTGIFGTSSLIISIKTKVKIPDQINKKPTLTKGEIISPLIASFFIAPLCSFIPALGSGQAAILASSLIKATKIKFLIILGLVNNITLALSFIVLFSIQKSRTGVAVIINKLIPELTLGNITIILIAIILASIISFFLTLFIAKQFSLIISKINYSKLSVIILVLLFAIVFIFSGIFGILILLISTSLGIYGILSNVKRINLMGCLLLPTILIYLI